MTETHAQEVLNRIDVLERKLRHARLGLLFAFALAAFAAFASPQPATATGQATEILRVKGLVIEDAMGRPRIIMGAPAPKVEGRRRQDELVGLAYIDENGADRLTFGKEPDPMTGEGIKPRRVGGAGILIHDKDGIERGGYAVLDDGMAALTIDWPKSGEAVTMGANNDFAALAAWHFSPPGQYREAVTIGAIRKSDTGFVRFSDTKANQRLLLAAKGNAEPELQIFDASGKEIRKAPIR
jgi:hypothetical protein